jgi:hypothetical protein
MPNPLWPIRSTVEERFWSQWVMAEYCRRAQLRHTSPHIEDVYDAIEGPEDE